MSNALVQLPTLAEIGSSALPANVIAELTKSGDYLERIQLYQGGSNAAKENKVRPGHYGIPRGEDVDDLGDKIDVLVFAVRPKALDTSGEVPIASHNPESAEFKRIKETAETVADSGCMFGLEFLVFERTTGKFYTYFASSASARREAGKMLPTNEPLAITMSSRFVKKQYSWHVPVVSKCSVAFANAPSLDEIKAAVEKFFRSGEEVEAAPETTKRRVR
jgi:hypothetical protein